MAREREAGHSFDPRTWGGEARPRGASEPVPTPAARVASASPAARPHSASNMSVTPVWLAFGGAALLLAAGALVARLYPSRPAMAATAAQAAAIAPVQADDADHRTLTVAEPAAIADTLRAAGVAAGVADGAAREVGSMLTGATGEITLIIDLSGPATARELTRLEAMRATGGVVLTARPDGSYSSEPLPARISPSM